MYYSSLSQVYQTHSSFLRSIIFRYIFFFFWHVLYCLFKQNPQAHRRGHAFAIIDNMYTAKGRIKRDRFVERKVARHPGKRTCSIIFWLDGCVNITFVELIKDTLNYAQTRSFLILTMLWDHEAKISHTHTHARASVERLVAALHYYPFLFIYIYTNWVIAIENVFVLCTFLDDYIAINF